MIGNTTLTLIAAMDRSNAIGDGGDLPWHIPTDLKFFKEQTLAKTMVMGRKTYQSIGRPLPGRTTLVLTRDTSFTAEGTTTVASLEDAARLVGDGTLIVAGGGEIYRLAMPFADHLILTHIDLDVGGDTRFPAIDDAWNQVKTVAETDEKTGIALTFAWYDRA